MNWILYPIFAILVGFWAHSSDRNGYIWGGAALLFSPLLISIVLLIVIRYNKNPEKY